MQIPQAPQIPILSAEIIAVVPMLSQLSSHRAVIERLAVATSGFTKKGKATVGLEEKLGFAGEADMLSLGNRPWSALAASILKTFWIKLGNTGESLTIEVLNAIDSAWKFQISLDFSGDQLIATFDRPA